MTSHWITFLRFFGVFLIGLIAYHYINDSLGFSISQSVSLVILGVCLSAIYQGYQPNRRMLSGWAIILIGCLGLSLFKEFSWLLIIPVLLVIAGYSLAGLPIEFGSVGSDGGCGTDAGGE